jgi:hypothetical protein
MNPASNQPEHARRRRPPHGPSRAGLAGSILRHAFDFVGGAVVGVFRVVVGVFRVVVSGVFFVVYVGGIAGIGVLVGSGRVGVVVGVGVGVAYFVTVIRNARNWFDRVRSADQRGGARLVLRLAAGLLCGEARAEWLEESEVWLLDLHEAGEPWYRLLAEQLSILTRLPWLVMIHWLNARRAVDR